MISTQGIFKFAVAASFLGLAGSLSAEPLKVAIIDAFTGPVAIIAKPFAEGTRYAVKKLNAAGGFNGQPIQLLEYDNQSSPAVAADKLKAAIADGAKIISQTSSSAIGAQITEDVRKYNERNPGKEVIFFNNGGEAYDYTAERCHFYYFKLATNAFIRYRAIVKTMKDKGVLGSKIYTINPNYSYGQESQVAQIQSAKEAGSEVVGSDLHDLLKVQDFSPYIGKVKASGAQTILTSDWGTDIILILRALGDAGLKIPVGNQSLDTPGTLASAGTAAEGAILAKLYNTNIEKGQALNEDFKKEYGHLPAGEEPTSIFAFGLLGNALKMVDFKGGAIDAKQIALAIEKASFDTPGGKWSIRKEDHQVLLPVYISEVSKGARDKHDGTQYGFKIIKVVSPEESAVPVSPKCKMNRPT